jgi:hypothetical protein
VHVRSPPHLFFSIPGPDFCAHHRQSNGRSQFERLM